MAINLFFLRKSPVGTKCCCPLLHYFTINQQGEEVSPAGSICPHQCPHAHSSAALLGKGWCDSYQPWEESRDVRGAENKTWWAQQTSWSIQKTVWDSRTAILRAEPPCTRESCGITKWVTWVSQLSAWSMNMFNLTSFFLSLFWSVDGVFWSSTIVELLYDICPRQ